MFNERGFTLIELLVVILIIGIMTSLTLLAFGDFGSSRKLKSTAETLAAYIKIIEEKALIESKSFQIKITADGYETFYVGKSKKLETISGSNFFHFRAFPKDTVIDSKVSTILVYPTGQLKAFKLKLGNSANPNLVYLRGKHNGDLEVDAS